MKHAIPSGGPQGASRHGWAPQAMRYNQVPWGQQHGTSGPTKPARGAQGTHRVTLSHRMYK
eukprot:6438450-Pyramimonas_sp.AAC.1